METVQGPCGGDGDAILAATRDVRGQRLTSGGCRDDCAEHFMVRQPLRHFMRRYRRSALPRAGQSHMEKMPSNVETEQRTQPSRTESTSSRANANFPFVLPSAIPLLPRGRSGAARRASRWVPGEGGGRSQVWFQQGPTRARGRAFGKYSGRLFSARNAPKIDPAERELAADLIRGQDHDAGTEYHRRRCGPGIGSDATTTPAARRSGLP